ncbi:TetR/AcrR family transcriptional regulator [Streptomyces sp. NPDC005533]|uniref:TetR/AcrR family transcriptional regulator n=1 Tax=Streptomyces sp. NPDC005533 TaxID=3364723 RepID=UPI00368170B7
MDVATEVFTAGGVGVPSEEIARTAGVGVGTLLRHFPAKEALLKVVMVRRLETTAARTAPPAAESGPAEAFFACFRLAVEQP